MRPETDMVGQLTTLTRNIFSVDPLTRQCIVVAGAERT